MDYDERLRRAARRATEAAELRLSAFVEHVRESVARLVEELTGSFSQDVPAFNEFMSELEARQAEILASLEGEIEEEEEEEEEEEVERQSLIALGFSPNDVDFFAEKLSDSMPDRDFRIFFSAEDLERAIRGGYPREYIEAVYISEGGLIYVQEE